ncbi:hypothetical protein C8J56DRAFT_934088 [Mycena floridula]|nr:hypothetical protein C8J56DRAFT_934088 [Mycena floridula]
MALSSSPRKTLPLATGDETRSRYDAPSTITTTKRVFFCGVIIEGSENGRRLPEEIQDLVLSLGDILSSDSDNNLLSNSSDTGSSDSNRVSTRQRALTDSSALASVISELVTTERSYVQRLQALKNDYADPLRNFARSKNTAIIPAREARILFGNIDNLLPVNEAFLTDLEKMLAPNGAKTVGGVGDVALKHFKERKGFEQYRQYYVQREDAQLMFEREVSKRGSPFDAYIDRIKYQSTDTKNRVGLRELLMDPVQRIPRYTLLFRTMIKHMAPGDPQRAKLIEADEIASKIALAEADEQTKRAAILYCLSATIEAFPPDLFSYSRRHFIDCIDVEDVLGDVLLPSSASISSSSSGILHCTLFLFDDKLLIAKRPGNGEKGGRLLSGLDELDKVMKAGGIPTGKKKSGMICKGVIDITDVVATDVGGADFHLYLETTPQDQGDRWSGRAFRSLSVVHPPAPVNLDPVQSEADKQRFLENLWAVQAKYRARSGQSVVLRSDDVEVESKSDRVTTARTYYNVYQRTAFLQENKKTKVVVHIDALGCADKIPFGMESAPFVVIRLQPLAGGVCRYKVTSSDPSDTGEEDIVQTARVPSRIILTIHQFGLFQFKTGRNSRPSTPTARSKASIFGLDAISRNLFTGSSMGDFFSGSVNGHRRTKSTTSRSSTYTQTTTTGDGSLMKFSYRSNSTMSAATTVDDDGSFLRRSPPKSKKLLKRGVSPAGSVSETEGRPGRSPSRSSSKSPSRSPSRGEGSDYSDVEDEQSPLELARQRNASDRALAEQLALARRNSKNQREQLPVSSEAPMEATIYEEDPSYGLRPASRASGTSRESASQCTVTPHELGSPTRVSRALSRGESERRPGGPRAPSPLPMSPPPVSTLPIPPIKNFELTPLALPQSSLARTSARTGIPRSKRQPFLPAGNSETAGSSSSIVEPLSIKKKTSVRGTAVQPPSPTPRKHAIRSSPMSRTTARIASPRRVSPSIRNVKTISQNPSSGTDELERALQLSKTTKADVESGHRAVKRIRLEREESRPDSEDVISRPASPVKGLRTPQLPTAGLSKAALERLEEMRHVIGHRQGDSTPRGKSLDLTSGNVDILMKDADQDLTRALSNHEALHGALNDVATLFRQKSAELEKARLELQNSRRQCEVVKSLLTDATTEKEIMYEAFNEELDSMYNDANLPEDEAWAAMSTDLRQTKEARNNLSKENSQLKRQLAESELQKEEWAALLRTHGLIP